MENKVFVLATTEDVKKEFNLISEESLEKTIDMYKNQFTPKNLSIWIKKGCKFLEELLDSVDESLASNGLNLNMRYQNYGSEEIVYKTKEVSKLFALFGYKNKSIIINEDDEISLVIFTHPEDNFSFTIQSVGTLICPPYGTDIYTDIVVLKNTSICIA